MKNNSQLLGEKNTIMWGELRKLGENRGKINGEE
jgi:hypothetical protein